jgi:hypothetical protein
MDDADFAVRIVKIAHTLRVKWPQDRIELMKEAGVFDDANQLDHNSIRKAIESDPTFVKDWLIWSSDKRYGGPWFWRADDDLKVACNDCATFIVAELGMFKEIRKKNSASQPSNPTNSSSSQT